MHTKCTRGHAVEILWKFLIEPAKRILRVGVSLNGQVMALRAVTEPNHKRAWAAKMLSSQRLCSYWLRTKIHVATDCLESSTTQSGNRIGSLHRLGTQLVTKLNSQIAADCPLSRDKKRTTIFDPRFPNELFLHT